MTTIEHDPLCVTPYKQQATCASCVLVARVRADERARELQASRETALTVASNVAALERHHAEALVLADLRAKVEALRDQSLEAFRSRPHQQHMGTMAFTLERVLALIEEASNG